MYDAIVVGARCAGASTAMLLARRGFKVLLVDKATFPSDTISTHILWPHGAEILGRWGLLEKLAGTGAPPICRPMTFDVGPFALCGTIPDANDGKGGFCPRRTVLDALLVNAAADSRVEIRQGFTVDELLVGDDAVAGVRGHAKGQKPVEERARMVIGADGVNSFVARTVGAAEYDVRPVAACGYYSYFSGVRQNDIELYVRDHYAFGGAPTNDGLHLVMVNWPASAPISRDTSGARSGPRPTSPRAYVRAVEKSHGTALLAYPGTCAGRMAKAGRSWETRATTEIRLRHRA
jgi:flavin-dependent dehydrogenase